MRDTWVVNASPLISLAKIGRLDLLSAAEREVLIPAAVTEEILAGPAGDPASVAPAKRTVVRDHDHLVHVVVKSECHLVKGRHVLIQGRHDKHVRTIPEISRESEIGRVITH